MRFAGCPPFGPAGYCVALVSQENVEIVKRAIRAWNERDWDAYPALAHPDFEYQGLAEWPGLPGESFRGLEELRHRLTTIDSELDDFRNEPLELIDAGERVVVVSTISGIGRRSGAPVRFEEAFVYTLRDRRVARVEACGTREQALEVAGLAG
jgi:ketosteroid isomerase-like protein